MRKACLDRPLVCLSAAREVRALMQQARDPLLNQSLISNFFLRSFKGGSPDGLSAPKRRGVHRGALNAGTQGLLGAPPSQNWKWVTFGNPFSNKSRILQRKGNPADLTKQRFGVYGG